MENSSPEKTITAIREATAIIDSKSVIDRQFPDLHKTFTDPPQYDTTQNDAVSPITLKQNLTMPANGLDAIKQFQPNSPCGIVPSINRAYFVVKNCLHIWDYVESRDIVVLEEEDDIVGVGFVKPKANIFKDDIQHLLIISTTREVKITAVSYNRATGYTFYSTDMTTNTSGVNMISIVGTNSGRVFMLGRDGNVWELDYRSEEGWFASRCSKKLHTSGSAFGFLLGKLKEPVVQIAVNEAGTVLYQLTSSSAIHVTYLGKDEFTFSEVCKKTDVYEDARRTNPRSSHLDKNNFKIISIHPTTSSESFGYHLVAVTSTGCRIYYNHHKDGKPAEYDDPPTGLVTIHVRTPSDQFTTADRANHAIYKSGLLMLVKNQQANATQDQIITYSPDLGNLANYTSTNSNMRLVEFCGAVHIHGKVITMMEAHSGIHKLNELTVPYNSPARHFLVLTTSGLSILVKQRPVDMFYRLLASTGQDVVYRINEFDEFFGHFGYVNSSSLCFNLICSASAVVPEKKELYDVEPVTEIMEQGAKILLERFGQVTSVLSDASGHQYTSRHDGLALFIYRVVGSICDKHLVKETVTEGNTKVYNSGVPRADLKNIQKVMKKLTALMEQNPHLFPKTPVAPETKSLANMRELVLYWSEAVSFFDYLIETGLTSIMQLLKPEAQASLLQISLKRLLSTIEGRSLASDLASALIGHTFKRNESVAYVTDILSQHFGSFCSGNDVILYDATQQIYSARTASNTSQVRTILTKSLNTFIRIALHIPVDKASEIADQFAAQGYHGYGIKLATACAHARDPENVTTACIEAGVPANDPRTQVFKAKKPFYDIAFKLVHDVVTKYVNVSSNDSYVMDVMRDTFSYDDRAYQYYMYEMFMEKKLGQILIKQSPPNLEAFLKRAPFSYERVNLLADYYRMNERYEDAAKAYIELARAPGDINTKTRIDNLGKASVCAKSVTSPAKQYEMYHLKETIEELLQLAHQQQPVPTQ